MTLLETIWVWASRNQHAYWLVFVASFFAVSLWESVRPLRVASIPISRRWGNHALLFSVSAFLQTLFVRLLPVGAAEIVQSSPIGLLNNPGIPFGFRCVLTVVSLDFLQYWMHRAFHSYFPLWRIHEVHHSDMDFDVATAARFHPLEVLPPQALRLTVILLLAPPPVAVLLDQLIAIVFNFTSHANASLPAPIESAVRWLFITPDLHRLHHSREISEQSTNFGQIFSIWDRMFGTYRPGGKSAHILTGLVEAESAKTLDIRGLLTAPFLPRK